MVRIAHATDIHWTVTPPIGRMFNKRLLGGLNALFGGRRHHFPDEIQQELVDHLLALEPDALVITGDLTALALEAEFTKAKRFLQPVLDAIPTLILPGNHDVYTRGAKRERRMHAFFGQWMGLPESGPELTSRHVARLDVGHVTVVGLDPNRPHLLSSGWLPPAQLDHLYEVLSAPDMVERNVIVALHYPILDRHGRLYDGLEHGLRNAGDLVEVLEAAPIDPVAICHGHEHHGYAVDLPMSDRPIPIFCAGSSGYAYQPDKRRAACMNLYEIDEAGAVHVERYMYGESGFAPEPGGAYATGR